jgi:DHA2 family multidrug resistance protein
MDAGSLIRGSKVWITVATMLAALMSVLDISIVNVALSDIRASFGTPLEQIAWVSTGYATANITIIPLSGWLQRRFGFRNYFAGSILLFTAASALCGLAWNLPSLVIFRILQGLGGGAIIPTSQNILFARYPKEQHGMAGALFGLGAITGPLLGPTLGGYLIDAASWHWIFFINVPLGLVAAYVAYVSIEEPGFLASRAPVDRFGIGLLAAGMVSLQYVLEEGNRDGWLDSPLILVLSAIALVSLATFVVHELETEHPVVDFRVFNDRGYTAATGLNFLVGTSLFAGSFLYSLFCGTIMKYSALDIGLIFLKGSWIQIILMPVVGQLIGKIDARRLIALGIAGTFASLWMNGHLTQLADTGTMTMPIFVRSCALALCFVPLSVVALSGLKADQRGNATGLFNMTRELGGSIGTAWMSTMLDRTSKQYAVDLASHVDGASAASDVATLQHGAFGSSFDAFGGALSVLNLRASSQALIRAFNDGFITLALVFLVSLGLVLLLRKPDLQVSAAGAH